jgi:hypothetical protein
LTVNVVALLYGVSAIVNILWPRSPSEPWYINFGILVTALSVVALGLIYMVIARPYERGHAPAGDAHLLNASAAPL